MDGNKSLFVLFVKKWQKLGGKLEVKLEMLWNSKFSTSIQHLQYNIFPAAVFPLVFRGVFFFFKAKRSRNICTEPWKKWMVMHMLFDCYSPLFPIHHPANISKLQVKAILAFSIFICNFKRFEALHCMHCLKEGCSDNQQWHKWRWLYSSFGTPSGVSAFISSSVQKIFQQLLLASFEVLKAWQEVRILFIKIFSYAFF